MVRCHRLSNGNPEASAEARKAHAAITIQAAGCHDPALLFSGMFDRPIRQIENTPAAQAGLSCLMCHSIVKVKSTMGQGDFVLEYPMLHELAASENPMMRALHDFMVKVNPEPHRRTFLKPFR